MNRGALAAAIVAALAVGAQARTWKCYVHGVFWHGSGTQEAMARRFEPLRAALPPRGTVGWISDVESPQEQTFVAYVLSPVVVASSGDRPLLVASFHSSAAESAALATGAFVVRARGGEGALLLERKR
jgi:hypothetical protein